MNIPGNLRSSGLTLIDEYLTPAECRNLLSLVRELLSKYRLPLIERHQEGRSLRYYVIDGNVIRESCPPLVDLYDRTTELVRSIAGTNLRPMNNLAANLNVNITPPGGEYRWHYDRNAFTALLYLNSVAGGEVEIYPNYRLHLGRWKTTRLQRLLDRLLRFPILMKMFGTVAVIAPAEGLLAVMRGDRSLHSVRRVEGSTERINVVMSFDEPRAEGSPQRDLDAYLYSVEPARSSDPNYRK